MLPHTSVPGTSCFPCLERPSSYFYYEDFWLSLLCLPPVELWPLVADPVQIPLSHLLGLLIQAMTSLSLYPWCFSPPQAKNLSKPRVQLLHHELSEGRDLVFLISSLPAPSNMMSWSMLVINMNGYIKNTLFVEKKQGNEWVIKLMSQQMIE